MHAPADFMHKQKFYIIVQFIKIHRWNFTPMLGWQVGGRKSWEERLRKHGQKTSQLHKSKEKGKLQERQMYNLKQKTKSHGSASSLLFWFFSWVMGNTSLLQSAS